MNKNKDEKGKKEESRKSINPSLGKDFFRKKKTPIPLEEYVAGIKRGDRYLLGKAITLVESELSVHQGVAQQIIERCLSSDHSSIRIGVTGPPGVGKSTFIEALGMYLIERGHRPAVLAIDPSSRLSRGSILGDKTRMNQLAADEKAFIRPSPTGSTLGGVARKTRETILLCEAAGFDIIIVETVGVGQAEFAVHSMADFFLLLLLPGAGDELQGIKRGIMEMADLMAVNKADGERISLAKQTRQAYRNAAHLLPLKENNWTPQVVSCSALKREGISEIWEIVEKYMRSARETGFFEQKRREQAVQWFYDHIERGLKGRFFNDEKVKSDLEEILKKIRRNEESPFLGAERLLKSFFE